MKRLMLGICLVGCALIFSRSHCFFIVNSSDSPKTVEVVTALPSSYNAINTPQVILKKELKIDEIIEAPFTLREVALDIHWGKEKKTTPQDKAWKPLEMESNAASNWKIIGTMFCGKNRRPCHAVIPSTWQFAENNAGITVTTDKGEIIYAASRADLIKKIPYRRIADTLTQERILVTDTHNAKIDWKKIGMNYHKDEEIVIPQTWSIKEEGDESVITTNDGKMLRIPLTRTTGIDHKTGKVVSYTIADENALKEAVPYRRKDGVVKEIHPKERLFVIEEIDQKPIKRTQYNIFRRFAARDAQPAPQVLGVPERIGTDHIFEISGTEYETDVAFMYLPYEKEIATTGTKRMHPPRTNTENSKESKNRKSQTVFQKIFTKRQLCAHHKKPSTKNSANN